MQPARITDGHLLESLVSGAVRLGVDRVCQPLARFLRRFMSALQ